MHISSLHAGPWSYFLQAVRTANSCMESLPAPPGQAGSSPLLLLSLSPRIHPQTAGESSPSTSPSSLGAKLLTWLPSAAPQMAMQACIHPCLHSARPPWTLTNCTCPAQSPAKSLMRERTRGIRWKRLQCLNKVGQLVPILGFYSYIFFSVIIFSKFTFLIIIFFNTDLSVREESDNDQNQSDDGDAEASPTKSPTTPKNIKCKNSSGTLCSHTLNCHFYALILTSKLDYITFRCY